MNAEMRVDDGGGRENRKIVDYPSNSKNARLQEVKQGDKEPVEKVVTGNVIRRKRGFAAKIFGDVVAEDSTTIVEYLITDVLIPAFKNLVVDVVTQGVERTFYGDSKSRSSSTKPAYTSYATRFDQGRSTTGQSPVISRHARATHNFADVILSSKVEAESVLESLGELIERYSVATVADFYSLVGITADFTDNKFGWTDLRAARVQMIRGGWIVRLPPTDPLTT